MTKRRIILLLVICSSIMVFTVQSLSQPRRPTQSATLFATERLSNMTEEERKKELERRRNMTPAERRREFAKRRKQRELEREQRQKESKKKLDEIRQKQKMRKEMWEKQKEEAGGFIHEKYALGATEEQWKVIKAKLERVRHLRDKARSTVGMGLTRSSSSGTSSRSNTSQNIPTWQWGKPWKDKAQSELTEAQKIAKQLIALVENNNTTPEQFRRKMDALRKARKEEDQIRRQLSEAQQELREVLTTRQEAALVLKKWL